MDHIVHLYDKDGKPICGAAPNHPTRVFYLCSRCEGISREQMGMPRETDPRA